MTRKSGSRPIGSFAAGRGQRDESVVVHPQHGDPGGHVFQSAVGLVPHQCLAGQSRQLGTAIQSVTVCRTPE
jgi:hypothetical protein